MEPLRDETALPLSPTVGGGGGRGRVARPARGGLVSRERQAPRSRRRSPAGRAPGRGRRRRARLAARAMALRRPPREPARRGRPRPVRRHPSPLPPAGDGGARPGKARRLGARPRGGDRREVLPGPRAPLPGVRDTRVLALRGALCRARPRAGRAPAPAVRDRRPRRPAARAVRLRWHRGLRLDRRPARGRVAGDGRAATQRGALLAGGFLPLEGALPGGLGGARLRGEVGEGCGSARSARSSRRCSRSPRCTACRAPSTCCGRCRSGSVWPGSRGPRPRRGGDRGADGLLSLPRPRHSPARPARGRGRPPGRTPVARRRGGDAGRLRLLARHRGARGSGNGLRAATDASTRPSISPSR